MGMVAILFNGREPFEKNFQHLFDRMPNVRSGENCSSIFREEDIYRFLDFISVHSPEANSDNLNG